MRTKRATKTIMYKNNVLQLIQFRCIFLPRDAKHASAVFAIVLCLSVHLSQTVIVSKRCGLKCCGFVILL